MEENKKKYLKNIIKDIKKEFKLIKFDDKFFDDESIFLILFTNESINIPNFNKILTFKENLEIYFNVDLSIIYSLVNKRLEISFMSF